VTEPGNITTDTSRASVPAARPAALHRRARAAVARSTWGDRSLAVLLGLVLLAAGTLVTLLSYGMFGTGRAARPLLDPMIVDALRSDPVMARAVAMVAGVLLVAIGLVWASRSLRPERRPDLALDGGPDTAIIVSSSAAAEAMTTQVCALPGVSRARARMVGADDAPALRVTLWLADDADVRDVLARLHDEVLATARDSLEIPVLPVAVRLELESSPTTPRVA
jgi:hypothetical protein